MLTININLGIIAISVISKFMILGKISKDKSADRK